jgi:hypothetical protein
VPAALRLRLGRTLGTLLAAGLVLAWAIQYRLTLAGLANPTPEQGWHALYLDLLIAVAGATIVGVAAITVWAALRNARRISAEAEELADSERKLEQSRRELETKRKALENLSQSADHQQEIARLDAEIAAAKARRDQAWMKQ